MTACEQLAPLLVARPLGLLEPEHDALVGAHLPGCEACQGFAREVARALDAASVPPPGPEVPGEDPPGWAALAARLATKPPRVPVASATPRWVWAGVTLIGLAAAGLALWPAPPAPPALDAPPARPGAPPLQQEPPPAEAPPVREAPPPLPEAPAPTVTEPAPEDEEEARPRFVVDGNVVGVQPGKIVLSVGEDDRVELGMHFEIYRGEQVVGEVVVERVLRDSCWCRETSVVEGQAIQPGDSARSLP